MRFFGVFATVALGLVAANSENLIEKSAGSGKEAVHHGMPQTLSTPEECARKCRKGEPPLTCHYHFAVENYSTMGRVCELCRSNTTTGLTPDCQCIIADGYVRSGLITANRQYPGPSIMVCKGDYVVIDVANRIPGNAITIHWHGIHQKDHQYYDGVPFVTQCPIGAGTTFRYQWGAKNSGTHFWHAHTGLHKVDGLEGPLIIREPKPDEPNNQLWDHDRNEDFIFIDDWFHNNAADHFPGNDVREIGQSADNLLINGKGQWRDPLIGEFNTTPLAIFTVQARQRYRFRLINACSLSCPIQMTIQGHNVTVIAGDGSSLEPFNVTSITSLSAERYDFVLNTNQEVASYWIQFRATGRCTARKLQQVAILRYETAASEPVLERPTYDLGIPSGIVFNPQNIRCNGAPNATNVICVDQLRNAHPVPPRIIEEKPDIRIFLPIGFYMYDVNDLYKVGTYKKYMVPGLQGYHVVTQMGKITNAFPASPLLTQRGDIPDDDLCAVATAPAKCNGTLPCECVHVEDIPLNALVEFVLVDEDHFDGLAHPFHLHGHYYYIMKEARAEDIGVDKMTVEIAKDLLDRGSIKRNYDRPPAKDTHTVPNNGIVVIRMIATNPGYWMFHCHFAYHLIVGMNLILHVGEDTDLPPIPEGFPKSNKTEEYFSNVLRVGDPWLSDHYGTVRLDFPAGLRPSFAIVRPEKVASICKFYPH